MSNLQEINQFDDGVYQIETTDPVLGGPNGIINAPFKALANRTRYLLNQIQALQNTAATLAAQSWVQDLLNQRDNKQSVRAATTANINLAGLQTIDGVLLAAGDRVLVKNQNTASQNGLYAASGTAWTRTTDADAASEVTAGLEVFVSEGALQGNTRWQLVTDDVIDLGNTALLFQDVTQGYAPLVSPTFTGSPKAPTPAQFLADTSIATAEFVQRALGSYRLITGVTASYTLTAADIGTLLVFNSSNNTLTLPVASSVPRGATISFISGGASGNAVARNGNDVIYNAGSDSTRVLLNTLETVTLVSDGLGWYAADGSALNKGSAMFGASTLSSGWQKLPSGLIIQWGSAALDVTAFAVNWLSFPMTFPNALRLVMADNGDVQAQGSAVVGPGENNNNSGFNWISNTGGSTRVNFIAIGI